MDWWTTSWIVCAIPMISAVLSLVPEISSGAQPHVAISPEQSGRFELVTFFLSSTNLPIRFQDSAHCLLQIPK